MAIILEQNNTYSIRNKFDGFVDHVTENGDILMIAERKLDESFLIPGYTPLFWFDRISFGGGMLYIKENIPSKLLSAEPFPVEAFFN